MHTHPHVTLAIDDEQHSRAELDEVLPAQDNLFSVPEKKEVENEISEIKEPNSKDNNHMTSEIKIQMHSVFRDSVDI